MLYQPSWRTRGLYLVLLLIALLIAGVVMFPNALFGSFSSSDAAAPPAEVQPGPATAPGH
jgi:hypothetical protein